MLNRTIAPDIKDAVEFNLALPPLEKFRLDNGIPVYIIRSEAEETLQIDMAFPAGAWYEIKDHVAAAANHLMKNGSSRSTALEINDAVEYYGAFLNRGSNHEYAGYVLHSLSRHIEYLLPILQEIIFDPVFPQEELDIYRQNMKQRLAVNLRKCDFVANRHIDQYLFGARHPYGRVITEEAIDALQREDLHRFYKKHYSYNNCRIFVAGKLPENILTLLNRYFGKTKWNEEQLLKKDDFAIRPAGEKKYRISNDPDGVQGAVRVARPFPNRYHPDFPKMLMLNTIFGGYFGSRLMSNIREKKGYTYGIYSQLYNTRQQSAINIQTEAGREVCEATIEEIYKEMELLKEQRVEEDELSLVRNFMIGSVLGDLDGAFQVIQRWKSLILNDLDEHYFYNQIQTVKTIGAGELQQLAEQYFNKEEFYELVVV